MLTNVNGAFKQSKWWFLWLAGGDITWNLLEIEFGHLLIDSGFKFTLWELTIDLEKRVFFHAWSAIIVAELYVVVLWVTHLVDFICYDKRHPWYQHITTTLWSKEVWKLNFGQCRQLEKHSQEEAQTWRK